MKDVISILKESCRTLNTISLSFRLAHFTSALLLWTINLNTLFSETQECSLKTLLTRRFRILDLFDLERTHRRTPFFESSYFLNF